MKDRRVEIRPIIKISSEGEYVSFSERFQNQTLRPIIKLQHNLLIAVFKSKAKSKKLILKNISDQKLIKFIDDLLFKDPNFRPLIIGLITGHFTVDEFNQYEEYSSEINKRIIAIIDERLINSLKELK